MIERAQEHVATLLEWLAELPLLSASIGGNEVWRWLAAILVAIVVFGVLRFALSMLIRWLGRLSGRTLPVADDVLVGALKSTKAPFLAVMAMLAASSLLELSDTASDLRRWTVVIVLTIQVGIWAQRAISIWLEHQRDRLMETDPGTVTTLQGLSYVVRAAIWVAVAVLILDNLGYNVSALLAGLGIGGVAVALALQNVLGDLFASLSIALDKPFVTGDFIIVDDKMGTVSRVGLKTTRETSLSGEQLVFSNSDLLNSRIRNFKRMQERRVAFGFGVLYQTSTAQLEKIPGVVREIIENLEQARFDRAHFKEFGDSAYTFEVVYYVLAPDYNLYMDCQQQINLELCRRFEEMGVEFAYPTRTLHIVSEAASAETSAVLQEA